MARPQSSLNSMDRLAKIEKIIPGGTSTNAKSPSRLAPPITPNFAVSAAGAEFIDDDGRNWIDCDMGLAAVVWGHARTEIDDAVISQIRKGVLFSAPPMLEGEAAELILDRLQEFAALRFVKTGSDAVSAAVRVARAATGRTDIIIGTYHGWHDWAIYPFYGAATGVPAQVGQLTRKLPEETAAATRLLLDADVAAVVVCPEQWEPEQLKEVVQLVRANGSIVIFDEVKSGLRVGPKGVWHKINIIPDLLCIAKGLANGYPLAALVGSAELMKFVPGTKLSSTYATDCVSLAAAIAAEKLLQKRSLWPSWEQSAKQILSAVEGEIISNHGADRLRIFSEINTLYLHTPGINPADDPFRHTLIRGLAKKGVFTTGHWIIMSDAHQPHHVAAIEAALIDVIREWLSS